MIRLLTAALLTLCAAFPATAGTSADYTLEPSAIDAGGQHATSPAYAFDLSATAGGPGTSTDYTLDSSLPGQLEVTTLIFLTLAPESLAETTTGQLTAELVTPTGLRMALNAGDLTWSIWTGPLSGVTPNGEVTTTVVPRTTRAAVRAVGSGWSGILFFTVDDTIPDNFLTYAGDGLPDDWQVLHFGTNHPAAGPAADPDGDTHDNLFEYHAGLNPADPDSQLRFSVRETAGGNHEFTLTPRNPGTLYTLMGSSDLTNWSPVTGPILDNGLTRTIQDPAGAGTRRFYSLTVQRP